MDIMLIVIAALQAYVLGSINFAVIFTNLFTKKDVRDFGSGNAGMTNVLRVAGPLPGILTFICDAAKGAVACFILSANGDLFHCSRLASPPMVVS